VKERAGVRPIVLALEGTERVGGGQRVTQGLVDRLRAQFEFVAAVPATGPLMEALTASGVEAHVVPYPAPAWKFSALDRLGYLPSGLLSLRRLVKLVRESDADLVYATSRTALWAALAGRLTGRPIVVHLHLIPPTGRTAWFLERVCSMSAVRDVIVASPAITERVPALRGKAVYVPNGVDTGVFRPEPELRAEARAELGIPERRHLAMVIGEVAPDKGQDDAIAALGRLAAEGHDAGLVVVGAARKQNVKFEDRLRRMAAEAGFEDRVLFTGQRSDVHRLLNGADLLIVPSKGRSGEACPMAVLEAWACGVPVVGAAVGGLPELLSGGRGITFQPGDVDSLASAWRSVVSGTADAPAMRTAGLAAARGEFSLEKSSASVGEIFAEALRSRLTQAA
jgi:glycosyltransferase involved in cell wall biosynthesis